MQASTGHGFEHLGFEPAFAVELDPEFPATGLWSSPVYAFDRDGRLVDEFASRWGAPRVIVVRPNVGPSWVGMFPSSGTSGASGVFAMPNPRDLCVALDGAAFIVRVDQPARSAVVVRAQQVVGSSDPPLLLATSFDRVSAYGPSGHAWTSPPIAIDGLRIVAAARGKVVVADTGSYLREAGHLTELDACTGNPIAS